MAKYFIRFREPTCGVGKVPMLCDESGEPLPNQRSVTIKAVADDVLTATVEFTLGESLPMVVD
jgi:hypothetical protein